MAFVSVLSDVGTQLAAAGQSYVRRKYIPNLRGNEANTSDWIADATEQLIASQQEFYKYQTEVNTTTLNFYKDLEQKIFEISQKLDPQSLTSDRNRIVTDTSISNATASRDNQSSTTLTLGDRISYEESESPLGLLKDSIESNFTKIFETLEDIQESMPVDNSSTLAAIMAQLALIQRTQMLCCASGMGGRGGRGRGGGARPTPGGARPTPGGARPTPAGVAPSTSTLQTATATKNLSPAAQTRYQQLRAQGVPAREALNQARSVSAAAPATSSAGGALRTVGRVASKAAAPLAVGLGVYDAYTGVQEANRAREAGEITEREATIQKSEAVGGAAGGTAGALALGAKGAAIGGTIGAAFGGVGAVPGAIIGGLVGSAAGFFGGSWIGKKVSGAIAGAVTGEDEPKDPSEVNLEDYVMKADQSVDLEGLDPAMKERLSGLAYEYHQKTGRKIQVNSGYRSTEKQAELYARLGPGRAAPPGRSRHESGLAVDINSSDAGTAEELGLLEKYGFVRPVAGETWHVEPAESAGRNSVPDNPYQPGAPIQAASAGSKPVDVATGDPAPTPPPITTTASSTPPATSGSSTSPAVTSPTQTAAAAPTQAAAASAITPVSSPATVPAQISPVPTGVMAGNQVSTGTVAMQSSRAEMAATPVVINNVSQAGGGCKWQPAPPPNNPLPEVKMADTDNSLKASIYRDNWAHGSFA